MLLKRFNDPLGSNLPGLEQNILKLRAMEMVLVLFYAEELKREVLNLIQTTDDFRDRLHSRNAQKPRVPTGTNKAVEKALKALVGDRAITVAQKKEIVELIDYRNTIAHQMHNLLLDLSPPISLETLWRLGARCSTKPGHKGGVPISTGLASRAALPIALV
jgi:hypothetical protein